MRDLGRFVQMGSVDALPFAPRSKCDPVTAAALGPAVVTALGGVIESMFGSSSQDSANRTNLEIAKMNRDLQRETNEQNYKMFQEQNAWTEDMWNKQNEYNLPANQVQRLLDAGINPAAVFGNGSATPASSVQSQQAPKFDSPRLDARMNPYQPDFGVGNAVNAYMQARLMNSQVEGSDVDTQIKRVELRFKVQKEMSDLFEQKARIENILSSSKLSDSQRELYSSQKRDLDNRIRMFEDTFETLKERENLTNEVMRQQGQNLLADTTLKRLSGQYQSLVNQYFPQMQQAQLDKLMYETNQIIQNTELLVHEGVLKSEDAVSKHLSNEILKLHVGEEKLKNKIRNDDPLLKSLYYTSDYASKLMFGNLKLFGK